VDSVTELVGETPALRYRLPAGSTSELIPYGFVAVVDGQWRAVNIALVEAYGGRVERIPSRPEGLPSPDERAQVTREPAAGIAGGWFAGQRANPANPAGYARLVDERLEQAPGVDPLVDAVGTEGSLCGSERTEPGMPVA
jgi:cysteine synthase